MQSHLLVDIERFRNKRNQKNNEVKEKLEIKINKVD